jgi:hypothetical protein
VLDPAEDLAGGHVAPGVKGADDKALALVSKYKLTAAEIAAIRIFTSPDYAYINPATAKSQDWLASNVLKAKDDAIDKFKPKIGKGKARGTALGWSRGLKPLMDEGGEHAAKMLQAMAKLSPYPGGSAYRGERITQAQFDKKYKQGATTTYSSFSSAAKDRAVAEGYAKGEAGTGDLTVSKDQDVSVVVTVFTRTARDISELSAAFKKEEEVVILPGTKYKVEQVIPLPVPKDRGTPPARAFYEVVMRE